jgi:uncharacterized protein with GYD domain
MPACCSGTTIDRQVVGAPVWNSVMVLSLQITSKSETGGNIMPKYISLLNWTAEGIKAVKDSPKRLDAAKELARQAGGSIDAFYMTLGQYDMVAIMDAPNDEAAASFSLRLAGTGALRTTTLKAFAEADYRKIIGSL